MAEPYLTDIVGSFQRGQQFGTAQRLQREGEQRQSRLSELASLAYGAQTPEERRSLVGQAIATDPSAGFALGGSLAKDDENQQMELVKAIRLVGMYPEEQQPQVYRQVVGRLRQQFPGLPIPDEIDDNARKALAAVNAAYGGAESNLSDRYRVVGGALVDLQDPSKPVYVAPIQTDTGLVEGGPGGFREVRLGAAPPQAPMQGAVVTNEQGERGRYSIGADGRPVFIAESVPAAVAQGIQADPQAFATQDQVTLGEPAGTRILPRGAAAEQRRLELAERTAQRQEQAAVRSEESAARSEQSAARAEKQSLVQGERDLRKEVSDRVKDSRTILSAYDKIKTTANNPSAANDRALIFSYMKMLDPGSVVREGEFANAQNAAGVPDRVVNVYNNALRGEILNPDQRRQFAASASQIADSAQRQIDAVATEYRQIAEDYGFDPKRATGLDAPKPREPSPSGGPAPASPAPDARRRALLDKY